MLFEQRFIGPDHDAMEVFDKTSILSFGSEGCIKALPEPGSYDKYINRIISCGKTPKLVTPRVTQRELQEIIVLLKHIYNEKMPISIVVNDLGILYFCLQYPEIFHLYLGRQLCRSLLDSPWSNYTIAHETPDIQKLMTDHPFNDSMKLELLKEWGVKGIEINSVKHTWKAISMLNHAGYEIIIDMDYYLLTAGNICLAKRICGQEACESLCNKKFTIEPSGKWLGFFDHQVEFSTQERNCLTGMTVTGNRVLMSQTARLSEVLTLEHVVILTAEESIIHKLSKMEE